MADGSAPITAALSEARQILVPIDTDAIIAKAFRDSMLGGGDKSWFKIPSVRESLVLQLKSLGDVQRDRGEISFLTHLMEVTDRVYNHPRLRAFAPEYRAVVPINHDLEDICKKFGMAPAYVIARALALLSDKADFSAQAKNSLFLLMDPPNVLGDDRKRLQIERIPELDLVAVYTRYFDKYCTYARDLRNMLTTNPKTSRPYFEIKSEQEAMAYRAKLDRKQEVIMALPVEYKDHRAWMRLRGNIEQMIDAQIEPLVRARMASQNQRANDNGGTPPRNRSTRTKPLRPTVVRPPQYEGWSAAAN